MVLRGLGGFGGIALVAFLALAGASAAGAPRSQSLGVYWDGRLANGVQLAAEGDAFFTWDPVRKHTPNRDWRRVGSDRLVRVLLRVLDEFAAAHPEAPRVGIGDLSRPRGGDFGPRFGGRGHASHQNGLDADVYYPRHDGRERAARLPGQVDRVLAQELVDRFVEAGARRVFVGPSLRLRGPSPVVQALPHHDDHLHVRLPLTTTRAWENELVGHELRLPTGWRAAADPEDGSTAIAASGLRLRLLDYGSIPPAGAQRDDAPLELGEAALFRVGRHVFEALANVGPRTSERLREQAVAVLESIRLTESGRTPKNVGSTRILGRSRQGRPIEAIRTGDPGSSRRVLVVGCIHGNECAGMRVTQHLASLVRTIPFDLWLVPNLNPDGLAARTRGNARGVDLNRDFDAFAEPETRIARELIERISPDLTLWFHQPQGLVRAWGPSRATARRYARLAGETYRSLAWPPGSASRWQNALGQISFVVELPRGPLEPRDAARHANAVLQLAQ